MRLVNAVSEVELLVMPFNIEQGNVSISFGDYFHFSLQSNVQSNKCLSLSFEKGQIHGTKTSSYAKLDVSSCTDYSTVSILID